MKGEQVVDGSPAWSVLREKPGAREQAFSQKLSAKSKRVEVSVLRKERRSRSRVCTTWRHQPLGVRLDLLMRVGRGVTGDLDRGLFLQSGSSCISSRELLTDSSPAGSRAVLSVIHYCRRRYVLTAAADGIAKEQGLSEGQEVHFAPTIISLPCWGSCDFVSDKDRYYFQLCDQILTRQFFYFCFIFFEHLNADRRHCTRMKPLSSLPEVASQSCHPHFLSQISHRGCDGHLGATHCQEFHQGTVRQFRVKVAPENQLLALQG